MRLRIAALAGLLLCALPVGGCSALRSRSLGEAFKILKQDGDRELRDPMRPIRGGTRVLIFALDGVGHASFMQAVRSGGMPHTEALLGAPTDEEGGFAHGYAAPDVLSVLPSSTTAAWTSVFTGHPPSETGVPGNEWFDRGAMRFHAPSPVTVERKYQVLRKYNLDLLGRSIRVPTLYERAGVRSYVSLLDVYSGADLLIVPEIEPFGSIFNAAVRYAAGTDSTQHRLYRELDQTSIASLDESFDRYGIPDLQTVYFPGLDLITHASAGPLEAQRRYLREVIDPAVGEVLAFYRADGLLDRTYVLFVSDHGHTPTPATDRNALWGDGESEPAALLQRIGFRVRPFGLETDEDEADYQAVMAYQGGMAYVYLADRSTCVQPGSRCDWSRTPRLDEDVMEAVRAFDAANRTGAHVPELEDALDLILARTGALPGRKAPPFQVFDGERLVSIRSYLKRHPRPDLLDLERRLDDLAAGPHGHLAGDILLLSRMSAAVPITERTYFGEPYHSWHGSPNRLDSEVTFVLAHPEMPGPSLRRIAGHALGRNPSHTALTPLVLDLLGR